MTAETSNARGLVAKWRGLANEALRRSGTWNGNDLADRIEFMADELEAALATPPPPADAEVWDDDIDDEHSCAAGGPAWQEGFNAGRATGRNEALDELRKAPPEARGVVDVTDAMVERAAYRIPGAVPTLAKAREVAREILTTALTEARNVR